MDILKDWDLIIRFKNHFLFHTLYYQAKRAPVWEQSLAKDLRRSLKGFRSDSGGKRLAAWVKKTMQSIPAGRKYWLLYCFSIYSLTSFFPLVLFLFLLLWLTCLSLSFQSPSYLCCIFLHMLLLLLLPYFLFYPFPSPPLFLFTISDFSINNV